VLFCQSCSSSRMMLRRLFWCLFLCLKIKMMVVTIFLLILNWTEFRFVQNKKENCNYDHIWCLFSCLKIKMIVVTIFLLILNQTEFRLVHIQKKNCNYGRIWLYLFDVYFRAWKTIFVVPYFILKLLSNIIDIKYRR